MSEEQPPPWFNMAWQIAEERKAFLASQPRNPPLPRQAPVVFDVEYRSEWRYEWHSEYRREMMAALAQFGSDNSRVAPAPKKDRGRER